MVHTFWHACIALNPSSSPMYRHMVVESAMLCISFPHLPAHFWFRHTSTWKPLFLHECNSVIYLRSYNLLVPDRRWEARVPASESQKQRILGCKGMENFWWQINTFDHGPRSKTRSKQLQTSFGAGLCWTPVEKFWRFDRETRDLIKMRIIAPTLDVGACKVIATTLKRIRVCF